MEKQIPVIQETREQEIPVVQERSEQMIQVLPEAFVSGGTITTLPYQEVINILDLDTGIYNIEIPSTETNLPFIGVYYEEEYNTIEWGLGLISVNKTTFAGMEVVSYEFVNSADGATNVSGYVVKEGENISGYYFYINQNELDKKQDEITSNNKLASDLVDDTNQTNKFVTAQEKTTWNGKADYGFTGIISGTSANPTDGATLANGTYMADPSKSTTYVSLLMENGITKKQSLPKGSIVIRTAGRLVVIGTQNLMYQYNTSQHYFYEGEPLVESYVRVNAGDQYADIGTLSPPNNKIVDGDIYSLDGVINTGEVGHAKLIFKVVDDLEDEPFENNLTTSDGEPLLYEDGAVPEFKEGMTYILDFCGHKCEIIGYKEAGTLTKDELLKRFMRQNSNQIYYPSVDSLPVITVTKAVFDSTTRNISIGESQDILIDGIHTLDYYNIPKYINLDLSSYDTNTQANQLHPETQLPDGVYYVTKDGRINFSGDIYYSIAGEIIFKENNEMAVVGIYGAVYYSYDTSTQEWTGGFFTTQADVENIIADINPMKGYKISRSTTSTGNISLVDGRWTKKTRATGITSGSCSTPNTLTEVPDTYRARFTLKTASAFTTFTVTQPANFSIYMVGDDCANGTITMVANKYYDVQLEADGFGDIIGHVYSYTLPS